jgi:hypothetical protein
LVAAMVRDTEELDQRGFGAVGDELDGVDEVFSAAALMGDALLGFPHSFNRDGGKWSRRWKLL